MQPKGSIVVECGNALLKNGYKLKILNTINFSKSMHYNPFAYVHSEKDILKLVTTLMSNTKGDGSGGDPFWEKSERLLLTALIAYLHYEAPKEEQNFATLLEMLNTMQVSEDDEDFQNPVDLLFEDLARKKSNSFAGRQYKLYKLAAGYAPNSGKSILGNFIQKLYPENSVSNLSLGELGGKFETESLLYSRINISLDLPQEVLNASAVSKLKRITGGDSIEIQRKNQGALKLDHNMKFLFATNFPLRIESNDPAFLDRIIFLPFMNSVPKEERDPNLAKKLWKERDAIVTKALQYARKLMKQGWQFPPIPDVDCMRGIQRKNSMDYLKEFLENHCEMGDYNYFTATSDLRRAYEAYCDENGTCPCSATAFNKYMEQAGGVRDRKRLTASENPVWGFYGIRLRP